MVANLPDARSRLAHLFSQARSRSFVRAVLLRSAVAGLVAALGECAGLPLPPKARMSPVPWTWVVKWLFALAVSTLILWLMTANCRAAGYADIRARCLSREILTPSRANQLVYEWLETPHHKVQFSGTTASMEPNLSWWDDMLCIEVTPDEQLQVGAIYIYQPDWHEKTVVHQLVRISGDMVLFRGTNNVRYDPWAKRDKVMYRVVRILGTRRDDFAGGMNQ